MPYSPVNSNSDLITQAKLLSTDILANSEPTEKQLSRTRDRVIAGLLGYIGFAVLGLGLPAIGSTLCFADAANDAKKLGKLDAKLLKLQSIQVQPKSEQEHTARLAHDFQTQVNKDIRTYTNSAMVAKFALGLGLGLMSLGHLLSNKNLSHQTGVDFYQAGWLAYGWGAIFSIPAGAYALFHWNQNERLGASLQGRAKIAQTDFSIQHHDLRNVRTMFNRR